ncbi:MAG: hypothetical protein QOE65_1474 [Solirubrobacteraceae bacterium]|jgi:hypothetical protein|nr:hypothetical protein [Solirubrobacteraceae bacterium]
MHPMGRLERLAPLTGILAVALIVAAFTVFADDTPESKEGIVKVAKFWRDHDSDASLSAVLLALAAVPMTWFAGSMRKAIRLAEPGRGRLSHIAFAGLVILSTGLLVGGALQFALGESADDLSPQAIEALNAINVNFWFPYIAGIAIFMLATGVAVLRHRGMHVAFGVTALLLGIIGLTPVGFFAFLASGPWIVAAAIYLFLRGDAAPAAPTAPAATAPASSPGSPS